MQSLRDAVGEAVSLLKEERIEEAEAALAAILEQWPDQPDALHFLGLVRHTQGRTDDAVALIERALTVVPGHVSAWNNLGNVLLFAGRLEPAVVAYERGLEAAGEVPETALPLSNLGVVYRKLGRLGEAESACRRAVAIAPDFPNAWYNLSLALLAQRRIHDGLIANSKAIALMPQELQARDQVLRALLLLGEKERAAELYREWLREDPDNVVVRHQLAACTGEGAPARASDAYVRQLFDSFASSFDAKLEKLDYRAPDLVAEAVRRACGAPGAALDVVDAGCGTGLCGPLLRPWARRLAGCDLSVGMLRLAHARGSYDVLHEAELVFDLNTQPEAFDLVVSADTLCYFGALEEAMHAARRALRPGGRLVFTVEAMPPGDEGTYRLQSSGRYAHAAEYVRDTIAGAGLSVLAIEGENLRSEAGLPVAGWLVTAAVP